MRYGVRGGPQMPDDRVRLGQLKSEAGGGSIGNL